MNRGVTLYGMIADLRRELPADVYLWVNAYKRNPDYYTAEMVEKLTRLDPLFPVNNQCRSNTANSFS